MTQKSSWEQFFDAHAPIYDENIFTKNTIAEVDFLLEELSLRPGDCILDVGCGTGRHSIELARRGYTVTGLDLSEEMLARAAKGANEAGVSVRWVHSDAADLSFPETFDAVLGLCEGAFGLLSQTDDPIAQPLSIFRNLSQCLKPGAKALLTVLSAARLLRKYSDEDVREGRFDPLTLVETSSCAPREGRSPIRVRERAFVPTELVLLCGLAGLRVVSLWGGTAGNWGRRPLDLDEYEIMIVAQKTSAQEAGLFDFPSRRPQQSP